MQHNPRYHGLEVDPADAYGDGSLMDEVMQLMQAASAFDSGHAEATDPDVQVTPTRPFLVSGACWQSLMPALPRWCWVCFTT